MDVSLLYPPPKPACCSSFSQYQQPMMTIEDFGVAGAIKTLNSPVDKAIKKRRSGKKAAAQLRKPLYSVNWNLQKLFQSCQQVFKGPGTVPCPDDARKLCQILDKMSPEDVGLSQSLSFFQPKSESEVTPNPRVTTTTIYRCQSFEISIFFLPANARIPLHNHPEMTVFSKLLIGNIHIKAYDWVDQETKLSPPSKCRLAKVKADKEFSAPSDASVLYPTSGGNIHEFRAITPSAVLDILGPPYSKNDNRDCSYYREADHQFPAEMDSYRYLEELEVPEESEMNGIEYMGPQIVVPAA